MAWLATNYARIKGWADKMLATDTNGDGLVKYVLSGNSGTWPPGFPKVRPANWWDTIGFGYEDAYGNALAYRALGCMAHMAGNLATQMMPRTIAPPPKNCMLRILKLL